MNELFQTLLALTVAFTITPGDGRAAQTAQAIVVPPAPVVIAITEITPTQQIEVAGKVEKFDDATITINGTTFALAKNVEIKTTLKVGDTVKIEAKMDDGKLVVTEIKAGNEQEMKDDKGNHPELGDDKGNHVETGDDKGNHVEAGDDKGNHAQPGDDKGNHAQPGDDKGGEHRGGDEKGKK